jgi:chloramphenicol 3-O phosphotransferase
MAVRVIVLNGTSSSGKSSIARCLQSLLPEPWLTIAVDDLITAVPPAMLESEDGLTFTSDGEVIVGPGYRKLEEAWSQGVAAMARAGTGVILDQVFLKGVITQRRWNVVLEGLQVLWVGVRCDPLVATVREANRGDRVQGMAAKQASVVHQGMVYAMEVDTTHTPPEESARLIVNRIKSTTF